MVKLLDSSMTLAEAQTIADEMGMTLDYVLTVLKRRRTRKNAHGREARSGHGPAV
jgi:antitoxin component of RelBE/YafQ-DinJ toxin-antitoxin module